MKKLVPTDAVLIPPSAKKVFQGVIFSVHQWQQERYDASFATFELLRRPDTVETIAILGDEILVLKDEQPSRGAKLSFAGGRVNSGEDIQAAAAREVKEETGYEFKHYRLLQCVQPSTKTEWFVYTFIAWDFKHKSLPHLDPGERITVRRHSFDSVKKLVLSRTGHLGGAVDLFEKSNSIADLMQLPTFRGKTITVRDDNEPIQKTR